MGLEILRKQLEQELINRQEKAKALGLAAVPLEPITLIVEIPTATFIPQLLKFIREILPFTTEGRTSVGKLGNIIQLSLPKFNGLLSEMILKVIDLCLQKGLIYDANVDFEVHAFLDVSMPLIDMPKVWAEGWKGEHIPMVGLDTGAPEHKDLKDRILAEFDIVGEGTTKDLHGHITHVAGIFAGDGRASDGKYVGGCPKAPMAFCKVLTRVGTGTAFTIIEGWQRGVEFIEGLPVDPKAPSFNGHRVGIFNISLGGYQDFCHGDCMLCSMGNKVWARGHMNIIAMGNSGHQYPPLDGYEKANATCSCPARCDGCMAVGAVVGDPNSEDFNAICYFSSLGPRHKDERGVMRPHVVGYGWNITSCKIPDMGGTHGYVKYSGTSMATPEVVSVCGQVWEVHYTWTNTQVREALMKTAKPLGNWEEFPAGKEQYGIPEGAHLEGMGLVQPHKAIHYGEKPEPKARLHGMIYDKPTMKPIQGTITVDGTSKATDPQGFYRFYDLEPGPHHVKAEAPKHITKEVDITLAPNEDGEASFALEPETTYKITVDGKAFAGNRIEIVKVDLT